MSGAGRHAGETPATQELRRRVFRASKLGVATAVIAEMEEIDPSYARRLIREAGNAAPGWSDEADTGEPLPPRRFSKSQALAKAWQVTETRLISKLGLACDMFWVRLVMAIHDEGDGETLPIGEPDCRFLTRDDLVDLFPGRVVELDKWLPMLFQRGRLVDLPGGGIAIPRHFKLTPAENPRRLRRKKPAAAQPQSGNVVRFPGGQSAPSDAQPDPPAEQLLSRFEAPETGQKRDNNGTTTGQQFDENGTTTGQQSPIPVPPLAGAPAAAAVANAKESQSLSSSSSIEPREAIVVPPEAIVVPQNGNCCPAGEAIVVPSLEPQNGTQIQSKRSRLAVLTDELMALAGIDRAPSADDLGVVKSWLDEGIAEDVMRAVIEAGMRRRNGKPPSALRYFDKAMRDARAAARPPAAASSEQRAFQATPALPATPASPLSAADQALKDELNALWRKAHAAGKSCLPPLPAAYQAKATNGHEAPARRWLNAYKACLAADSLGDLPQFDAYLQAPAHYEATMAAIEEVLSGPDPPAAA